MTVRIDIDELLFDIANKSHAELLAAVADPEERYRLEAGTEKRAEVLRCIEEAAAALDSGLKDFTAGPHTPAGDNGPHIGEGDALVWVFRPSERRYGSQADAVARTMHSCLVNTALALFYTTVGRTDGSEARAKLAAANTKALLDGILTKKRPERAKPYM